MPGGGKIVPRCSMRIISGSILTWLTGGAFLLFTLIISVKVSFADHPLGTEDTSTQGRGRAEMEINFEWSKRGKDKEYAIGNILTLGIGDPLDFSVEYNYLFLDPKDGGSVDGFGDTGLFMKYFFPRPGAAFTGGGLKIGAILPSGDESRGTGGGAKDYEARLILQRTLKTSLMFINLFYRYTGDRPGGASSDDVYGASLAVEQALQGQSRVSTVAEIEYETPESSGDRDIVTVLGGFKYALTEDSTLSFGVRTSLSGDGPDLLFTSGLTIGY